MWINSKIRNFLAITKSTIVIFSFLGCQKAPVKAPVPKITFAPKKQFESVLKNTKFDHCPFKKNFKTLAQLSITPDGKTSMVSFSPPPKKDLKNCLDTILFGLKFPVHKEKVVQIALPLEFILYN